MESKDGQSIIARYERLLSMLSDKETVLFTEWARLVPQSVAKGLDRTLLTRDRGSILLLLNFDPELLAVLKEVNYLKQMSRADIPQEALEVCFSCFRNWTTRNSSTTQRF